MKFPKEYFKKECRCGFEVPEMMKRAWAAQIEVLEVIDGICRKNAIQYFADWGTLLGAVRHKGFIPWDDDIDICLKREEYNRLIQILPDELPYGFVIAGMYADSERLQQAAYVPQLRVIADETQWNFNSYMQRFHGFPYQRVGIDIFPLDDMPEDEEVAQMQRLMVRQGILILREWDNLEKTGELQKVLKEYEDFCKIPIPNGKDGKNKLWKLIDMISSLYNSSGAEKVTYYGTGVAIAEFKKIWYQEAVYMPFENIQIPVPCGYDDILKVQFGDYMIPQRVDGGHDYPFYASMEEALKEQIRAVGFSGSVEEFCEKVSEGKLYV